MGRSRSRVAGRRATSAAVTASAGRRWPAWAEHVAALALLALVLGCVFPEIAWQRLVFHAADYDTPSSFAAAGRRALAAGEYPLWNPYLFLGMPSFASLSFTPWVFPPAELLSLLGRLPFMPPLGWLLVYFAAAGYGVFVLLRSLRCSFWPALVGGILFMLTPHVVSMGVFGHGSKLACVAFLPWLLWAALQLRHASRRLGWTALSALLLGLLVLRGHPQIAFYALLLLAFYGAVEILGSWRQRTERPALRAFAGCLALAIVLGLALGAVLLLPVRGYAPESIRGRAEGGGASYEFATGWSLSLAETTTFVLPSAMGYGEGTYVGDMPFTNFPNYLGQAALLGTIAAFVFLRGRFLLYLAVLLVFALLTSFGKNMPVLFDLLYAHLPYFNKFRVPVMILVLFQLATSIAAGLGLAALLGETPWLTARRRPTSAKTLRTLLLAAGAGAAFLLLVALVRGGTLASRLATSPRLPEPVRAAYAPVARDLVRGDGLRVALFLFLEAGLVAAAASRRLPLAAAGAGLALVASLDLAWVDRRMVRPDHTWPGVESRVGPRRAVTPLDAGLVRFLLDHNPDAPAPPRILPLGDLFRSNAWMEQGISSVGGYHPAKPTRVQLLLEAADHITRSPVVDMLSVQHIVTPEPLSGGPEASYSGPGGAVYTNLKALPRAWVVGRWRLPAGGTCVAALPQLDPQHEVFLETEPVPAPEANATGSARVLAFASNRVELEVQASAPALLVLAEAYHSHWQARVNGEARPVLAANCVLRAVAVPAGTSRVEFVFVDPALRAGLTMTGAAALGIAGLALGAWRRRVAAPPPAAAGPEAHA